VRVSVCTKASETSGSWQVLCLGFALSMMTQLLLQHCTSLKHRLPRALRSHSSLSVNSKLCSDMIPSTDSSLTSSTVARTVSEAVAGRASCCGLGSGLPGLVASSGLGLIAELGLVKNGSMPPLVVAGSVVVADGRSTGRQVLDLNLPAQIPLQQLKSAEHLSPMLPPVHSSSSRVAAVSRSITCRLF
jgi:hypothetical protein